LKNVGVLIKRLTLFLDENGIFGEEQAGFRKTFSTRDHLFVLRNVIDLYLSKGRRLYCAFIDYRKAFDSIDRIYLWCKLIDSDIHGKLFNVIVNMYSKAKSCVKHDGKLSGFFDCSVGVRQGENLSPILFALFLNDLKSHLLSDYPGLSLINNLMESPEYLHSSVPYRCLLTLSVLVC
jgi:hypothetical protein